MIIVDSSVWIDHFNGHASPEAEYLAKLLAEGDDTRILVPGIILTEILSGLRSDPEARRIAYLMDGLDRTSELDWDDYRAAANIFRTCRSRGETIRSVIDCLIAQLCLHHGYRLLSRDRDFTKIAAHFPLMLAAFQD